MTTNSLPPSIESLTRFQLGKSPPGEAETVGNWVSENSGAAETLSQIDATDSVTRALAQPAPSNECPEAVVDATLHTLADRGSPFLFGEAKTKLPAQIGEYTVTGIIGSGGMGVVLEGFDSRLKRSVAIKLIADDVASDPTTRDRFFREARAVARITHENVVPVLHVGEDGGRPYFVMPILQGEALDSRLKHEKPLPVEGVRRLARQVAAGLVAAHAVGLIHRDIKPANIWLDSGKGRVVLLDFGLVKPVEAADEEAALTRSGAVMGSPHYMSPQQVMGGNLDHRSDLFSLGVVLYEAVTGLKPFRGETTFAVLHAVMTHTPPEPRSVNPAVPAQLSAVIMKLLAKEPDDRYPDAEAVIAALDSPAPTPRPARKRRTLRNWIVTAGLLFAIGAVFAVVYQLQFKTKDGTLIVEVSGDAEVRFKNGELHIYGEDGKLAYTLKPGERNAKMLPGTYSVKVIGAGGVVLDTPEFTMTKDGQVTLRVTAKAAEPTVVSEQDTDRTVAEWVLSIGGTVTVNKQIHSPIRIAKELPAGRFELTGVNLDNNATVTDADLARFAKCEKLAVLHLNDTRIGDAGLANLKGSKSLSNLFLDRTQVTDKGLFELRDMPAMRGVDVLGTKVTAKGAEDLHKLVPHWAILYTGGHLKTTVATLSADPDRDAAVWVLSLGGGAVWVNGEHRVIRNATELPEGQFSLTGVELPPNPKVTDASLTRFKGCVKLKRFGVHKNGQITSAGIAHLKDCTELEKVGLSDTGIDNGALETIKAWKKLRDLNLQGTQVTDAGLALLKDLNSLRELYLGGTRITNKGLVHLEHLSLLRDLRVERTGVTLEDAKALAEKLPYCMIEYAPVLQRIIPELWNERRDAEEVLFLGGSVHVRINGENDERECKAIAELPVKKFLLTRVSLSGNSNANDFNLHFQDRQNLTHVNLSGTKLTDEGLGYLKRCAGLVSLDVTKTGVTQKGVEKLGEALPKCTIEWYGGTVGPKGK